MSKEIAGKFTAVREVLGLHRNKFANRLGISNSYISHIENGEREPGIRVINLLFSEMGVSREWFENDQGEMFADKGAELQKSLSNDETELVNTYRQLDPVLKRAVLGLAAALTENSNLD